MKKKLALVLTAVALVSSFAVGVVAKGLIEKIEAEIRGDFTVVIDGKKQTFRDVNGNIVEPILYNGTTYLPIRAIGEIMGKKVYWYQDEKKIELVDPSDDETLVTDADVIIDGTADAERPRRNEEAYEVTKEEAKEIVLEKAGLNEDDVVFTKSKLEHDDGRWVYEIDFKTDEARYDTEVDALNGNVIEWEVEEKKNNNNRNNANEEGITLEQAKEIALEKAGLKEEDVVFEEAKIDTDDGKQVYEIEFRNGRVEYTAEIDPANGKILEWEKDND